MGLSVFRWRRLHGGFSLIEVLVTLGVLSVLIGLLLPAAQQAREAARRIRCAGQLREIGLALQNYATDGDGFPPAVTFAWLTHNPNLVSMLSVHTRLLPFLEQGTLYDSINAAVPTYDSAYHSPENATAAATVVEVFLCPSDPFPQSRPSAATSYRANMGQCQFCPAEYEDRGAFSRRGRCGLQHFRDGLSNTIAFSEKPLGSPAQGSPFRDWVQPPVFSPFLVPEAWIQRCSALTPDEFRGAILDAGRSWMLGPTRFTGFYVLEPPNSRIPDCGSLHGTDAGVFTARSYHPGGVNTLLADGSVRWTASSVNPTVWRALGTRSGGEAGP